VTPREWEKAKNTAPLMPGFYNMDCMEGMRGFPDDYFDLAIVDPPYGVGAITYMPGKREKGGSGYIDIYNCIVGTYDIKKTRPNIKTDVIHGTYRKKKEKIQTFGDENTAPPPEYFKELFRVSKNQIIWGGNYYLLPPSRGFVVWKKTNVPENFSMAMCEFAWLSFPTNAKVFEHTAQNARKNDPRIHPTQKPVALYEWLLKLYAKPGDLILDTHVGSASSLIASRRMGHEYVGFEIDKGYFDVAQARLAKEPALI